MNFYGAENIIDPLRQNFDNGTVVIFYLFLCHFYFFLMVSLLKARQVLVKPALQVDRFQYLHLKRTIGRFVVERLGKAISDLARNGSTLERYVE